MMMTRIQNANCMTYCHPASDNPILRQLRRRIKTYIRSSGSGPPSLINARNSGQRMRFSTSHAVIALIMIVDRPQDQYDPVCARQRRHILVAQQYLVAVPNGVWLGWRSSTFQMP